MNKINFLGILRNYPDNSFPDGALNEAINVRYWNNAWRVVGRKVVKFSNVIEFDKYHIHTIDESKIFIGYDKDSGYIRYAVNAFPSLASDGLFIGSFDDISLSSIGNVLSVQVPSLVKTAYSVFDLSTGKYGNLFVLDNETVKIDFFSNTGFDYPLPSGVFVTYKYSFGNTTVYIGVSTQIWSWQYLHTKDGVSIVNLKPISLGTIGKLFYDGRVGYENYIKIDNSHDDVWSGAFKWDSNAKQFITANSTAPNEAWVEIPSNPVQTISFHAENTAEEHNTAFSAAYNKVMAEAKKIGQFEGFVMVCYALQLFDGTYIKHSSPVLLYVGGKNPKLVYDGDGNYKLTSFETGCVMYNINASEQDNINKLLTMKEVVKAVDIFITRPLPLIDPGTTFATGSGGGDGTYVKKWYPYAQLTYKTIVEQPLFYRIHSIPVEKLAPVSGASTQTQLPSEVNVDFSATYLKEQLQDKVNNLENITSFEYLPLDNYSHHSKVGRVNWKYNKRIILGDVVTKLYKGFWLGPSSNLLGANRLTVEVELKTEDGLKIVHADEYRFDGTLTLPEIFSYPDSRASVMRLLLKDPAGNLRVFKTLKLKSHPFLNLSYYVTKNANASYLKTDEEQKDDVNLVNVSIPADLTTLPLSTTQVNDLIYNTNAVWSSEVNNPFLFLAKNLYQVGNGKVLGLVSNTLPISQGQYGQHPIFVSCSDGWFALNIAGGEVFVGSITPLNGTVCTNPKSITYVDSSVIFASPEGLMLLQGTQCINISTQLCTQPVQPLSSDANYKMFVNNPALIEMDCFSTVDFREYLKEAIICFDSHYREVIVSNKNYGYSYIYSVDSKLWIKISRVFSNYLFDYPSVYSIDSTSGTLIQINKEDYTNNQEFIMCTQPIDLNEEGFKKFERLVLRCSINQKENKKFGFYMYGSQDGRVWQLYDGIQPAGSFNSLLLLRSLTFKQVIVLIAGDVDKDSTITHLEYSAVSKLANKLR